MTKQRILILEESEEGATTLFDYTLKSGEILLMDLGDQGDNFDCSYVITVDRTKQSQQARARPPRGDNQKH